MKKLLTTICLAASAVIILDTFQAGPAIVMFLLAGIIPGTNTAVEPGVMLQLFALIGGFVLSRLLVNWKNALRPQVKFS